MALIKFIIPIQSFSDVITNSSSSVFILDSEKYNIEAIESVLLPVARENWDRTVKFRESTWDMGDFKTYDKAIYEDSISDNPQYDDWSGDGGDLDVYIDDDDNLVIAIDHNRHATIKFIKDNFKIEERW